MVKGNWAVFDEEFSTMTVILQTLMRSGGARSAMLVDKTGQLINSVGEPPGFDVISFSSLAAADFSANEMLASMIGEKDFSTLVHQGTNHSLFLSKIATGIILVVIFDKKTSLGLVRLKARRAAEELVLVLEKVYKKVEYKNPEEAMTKNLGKDFQTEAESEIDSLFKD
jgi:predicted regulator of Ras-like GTPase activity (Roadblock/LC7/MglB family)